MMNSHSKIEVQLHGALGQFLLDAQFQAPMQGVTALFGPSGCGKTSVLRSIAGLQKVPGRIVVGGEVWQDKRLFVAPHRRPVGYVFQESSLFPHLSVQENLLYGYRRAKNVEHRIHADEVIQLLGLERLIARRPEHLSGGERQRVAIGRALLSQPKLLLMDEPLSALDTQSKAEILPYFERLSSHLSIPIILVSHDLSEVERLADYLVALRQGKVISSRPLFEALIDPELPFTQSSESAAVLLGEVKKVESDGIVVVRAQGQELLCTADSLNVGAQVRIRLAARDVSLSKEPPSQSSILNILPAEITHFQELGSSELNVHLMLKDNAQFKFMARITHRSAQQLNLKVHDTVIAQIKGVSVTKLASHA